MASTTYATEKEIAADKNKGIDKSQMVKTRIKDFIATAVEKIADSLGDMIVTVAVTGITLAYMSVAVSTYLVSVVSGYYIAAMMVQLFVRIVHRFDNSYTNDEIASKLDDLERTLETINLKV